MQWLCDHFYVFVLLLFLVHLLGFRWLWQERSRQTAWLAGHLENLIQGFASRADRDPYPTIDEQIDAFLANIHEAMNDPSRQRDRAALHDQITAKDETKKYLRGSRFETFYNLARTGIEIYPLLGIMGTVLAIGLALHSQGAGDPATATERIVRNFAGSIWATLAGVGCGVVLLLVNAVLEPGFQRLLDHRWDVRETISAVKSQLGAAKSQ